MIFSIEVRRRAIRSVEFVCPHCGLDRTGAEATPTRYAHVLGVPLIRLGELDAIVVCDDCQRACDVGVLDVPTTTQLSSLLEAATIAGAVTVVRAAGNRSNAGIAHRAVAVLREAGYQYDAQQLARDVATVGDATAKARLERLQHELTPHGKQGFLHRMSAIAMADGALTARQRDALVGIGCALAMAAPHINGILAVAAATAHADA
jgi:hypothetical protein